MLPLFRAVVKFCTTNRLFNTKNLESHLIVQDLNCFLNAFNNRDSLPLGGNICHSFDPCNAMFLDTRGEQPSTRVPPVEPFPEVGSR